MQHPYDYEQKTASFWKSKGVLDNDRAFKEVLASGATESEGE